MSVSLNSKLSNPVNPTIPNQKVKKKGVCIHIWRIGELKIDDRIIHSAKIIKLLLKNDKLKFQTQDVEKKAYQKGKFQFRMVRTLRLQ